MKITTITKKYSKYVLVLVAGLLVGGVTVQAVTAIVPDGSGTIHGCHDDNTGVVRVIDSTSQTCGTGETGINWDQNGLKGYARVVYDPGTDSYSVDGPRSSNVLNSVYTVGASNFVCLTVGTTPKSINLQTEDAWASGSTGLKDANGWTGSFSGCDTEESTTSNVGVMLSVPVTFLVQIY